MRLRNQLLLLSTLTLALPWAGIQGMRAIDMALRESHADNLQVVLEATATALPADIPPQLSTLPPLFVGENNQPLLIDGYGDEWSRQPWQYAASAGKKLRFKLSADENLHVFARIADESVQYYRPDHPRQNHDRLVIHSLDSDGHEHHWLLHTEAPAEFSLKPIDTPVLPTSIPADDEHVDAPDYTPIKSRTTGKGFWQVTSSGYQVEFSLPLALAARGLSFDLYDATANGQQNVYLSEAPAPLLQPDVTLTEGLSRFQRPGLTLYLVNQQGAMLAQHHNYDDSPIKQPAGYWIIEQLYKLMLATDPLPGWQPLFHAGQLQQPGLLNGNSSSTWFEDRGSHRLVQALALKDQPLFLLAVGRGDRPLQLASGAFDQLFGASLLLLFVAAATLLGYASWLSWRLRQLSHSAAQRLLLLDSHPTTAATAQPPALPQLNAKDEIGELANNFNRLLDSQQHNQQYLKTLASKLSHELRTPLAIVKSSLENLQQINPAPESQEYCQRAISGSERLNKLLTAMAEANYLEESINEADVECLPLDELVTEVFQAYRQLNPDRALCLDIQPGDYRLTVAPELIAQLLEKLVDNALDFAPEAAEIRLALEQRSGRICLSVSNQGPLLPKDMEQQLFDSLFSVRGQSSSVPHLGLGLFIVRLIARFHQAEVRARNLDNGSGVIFELTFPPV